MIIMTQSSVIIFVFLLLSICCEHVTTYNYDKKLQLTMQVCSQHTQKALRKGKLIEVARERRKKKVLVENET